MINSLFVIMKLTRNLSKIVLKASDINLLLGNYHLYTGKFMQWLPISNFIDIKGPKFLLWPSLVYLLFPVTARINFKGPHQN